MREFSDRDGPAASRQADAGLKPGGQTLTGALPHRGQMETAFGQDFSSVKVETGQADSMAKIGASAATRGESVAFGDANPSPWLVAHELTHVVQNRQDGATATGAVAKKATIAAVDSSPEREADAVADRVSSGQPAGPITARPEGEIHRFAPVGHRGATVGGLKDTFSAEEIGDIYASNWERDFSQGNGDIASAALSWLAVKNYATKHGGDPGPTAATFQSAVWKVVNGNLSDATEESLGSYKYWEHMDHPTASFSSPDKAADKRWDKHGNGLAGYLLDARAHIKDQMLAAVNLYREANNLGQVGGAIDNWSGAARPEGYVAPVVTRDGGQVHSTLPANFDDKKVASRDPVREETFGEATAAGAKSDPKYNSQLWRNVGQHLGRAMHSFEDFWAHSNWLEMAKEAHKRAAGGAEVAGGAAANKQLKTGTFEMASKAHALGHKLLALATGLQKDFPLLLKVYGRTAASTKIDSPEAKKTRSTMWGGNGIEANNDHDLAYKALQTDSYSTAGEISDVGDAVNNVEELVLSKKYKMEDFLCNQTWLEALAGKGRILIKQGDDNSDENAHGKLAKDQEESGSNKDYDTAFLLAKTADQMVFGPLRAVMDEKDKDKALAATQAQLTMVDTMLQAPTPSHPLWGLVK
jgi:hypothetical protein